MQYRNLGKSGLKVSAVGLGTNQFGGKVDLTGTKNIIAAALDAGFMRSTGRSPVRGSLDSFTVFRVFSRACPTPFTTGRWALKAPSRPAT